MSDNTAVPWRVGTHYPIHVYAGDVPVGTFHTSMDAHAAVKAHNDALGSRRGWSDPVADMVAEYHAEMKAEQSQRDLGGGKRMSDNTTDDRLVQFMRDQRHVRVTNPVLSSASWTGRVIALSDVPCLILERDDGLPRVMLPQSFTVTPVAPVNVGDDGDDEAQHDRALATIERVKDALKEKAL